MLKRPRNTTENNADSSDSNETGLSLPLQLGGEQTDPSAAEYVGQDDEAGIRNEQDNNCDNARMMKEHMDEMTLNMQKRMDDMNIMMKFSFDVIHSCQ